jgi:hypothetical protein
MTMSQIRCLVTALLLLLPAQSAWSWGQTGHRVVGELAQAKLSPKALAAVNQLLAGQPEPTLAGVSTWADEVRDQPAWKWTTPMHWVNFPKGQCRFDAARDCHQGLCVVQAVVRYQQELADEQLPLPQRREALMFLVHFVGDMHQPLHAGYQVDRGGNDFQISYLRDGWNLHSVWDSLIVDSLKLDFTQHSARLAATPFDAQSDAALELKQPSAWAEESCAIVQRDDFYPVKHKITGRYLEAKRPQADQRLKLAGARLAQLLNQTLDPP